LSKKFLVSVFHAKSFPQKNLVTPLGMVVPIYNLSYSGGSWSVASPAPPSTPKNKTLAEKNPKKAKKWLKW
jgi:hypothetical protein